MDENRIKYLLDRFAENTITGTEREEMDTWYEHFDLLEDDLHLTYVRNHEVKLGARMWQKITQKIDYKRQLKVPYRWAAAVTILLVSTWLMVAYRQSIYQELYTLTTKSVEVPKGKMLVVDLPDGSKVWVRSGSVLSYNYLFLGEERRVDLTGEAFFEVEKNPEKPFVVNAGDWNTRVLGTSFNVKALPDLEAYEVLVKTGKVQVSNSVDVLATMLPGDRLVRRGQELYRDHRALSLYTDWRGGSLSFDNSSMEEIVWYLENYFKVEINLEAESLRTHPFSGDFTGLELHQILRMMQELYPFEVEPLGVKSILIKEK
ncbi:MULTISPECIES: FecR family protein [Reichenbachiella]|uniref:FecR family protein n=1 Tax=Reichenbachiella TaxID=156993 RepID=UPI000E6D47B9|nr:MULTISPECIES: FecR domain-containing protein [Reichenbachiella]MBU2915106.1 FecR domain-containing protein [Reichenbachiella agariperforans]RJE70532.1 hypothetical protein BGP76_10620 [Reichenbachiella sp. MSK19-1]